MSITSLVSASTSKEAMIVNLNKIAHEKPDCNEIKILEKAKELSEKSRIPVHLRAYTKLNLCSYCIKEGLGYKALKIAHQEFSHLKTLKGYEWEKSLVLFTIGNIKSQLEQYEESAVILHYSIKLFKNIQREDANYFTVLTSAYYNCGVSYQKSFKFCESMKYFEKASEIANSRLGTDSNLSIFLKKKRETSIYRYLDNPHQIIPKRNPIDRMSPTHYRSKTGIKSEIFEEKHKFYKKFKNLSKSTDLNSYRNNKLQKKLRNSFKSPLSSLQEVEEDLLPKYQHEASLPFREYRQNHSVTGVFSMIPVVNYPEKSESPVPRSIKLSPISIPTTKSLQLEKEKQACKIQSTFRRYLAQKKYKEKLSAAVFIQKHIRRHQVRSIYRHISAAIVFIQSVFRGYKLRKSLRNT